MPRSGLDNNDNDNESISEDIKKKRRNSKQSKIQSDYHTSDVDSDGFAV